jgi:hypothetical protein
MLVWINGPYGGGKTQTAHELHRRLPGSFVCDPERIGLGLHRALPPPLRRDFQDLPAWRQGVYEVLELAASQYDAAVLVPMTLVEPAYFEQIVGRLRARGHEVRHFALLAERDTVVRRLRERGFGRTLQLLAGHDAALRRESFAVRNLDRCLDRLHGPQFAEHIWTDQLPIEQVADRIAASAGLTLDPPDPVALRAALRRRWVGVKHVRLR